MSVASTSTSSPASSGCRDRETVTDSTFARVKGGKGANQAVACARLGADVTLVCSVGTDVFAAEALPAEERLTLAATRVDAPTGVALILVDADGENQIAVAPGANAELKDFELPACDAVLAQLEIPDRPCAAPGTVDGLFCLNAAPARPVDVDADLTVVNRYELEVLRRRDGIVAVTLGAEGAILLEDGEEVARAEPPRVDAVDGTAAGDAFTACLLVSWLDGLEPRRRCAARAPRARWPLRASERNLRCRQRTKSTPYSRRDDAGHPRLRSRARRRDRAPAGAREPGAQLVGVTTTHGNQTLDKTTDNALRVLALVGRTDVPVAMGADRPSCATLHVAVHGESGLDGPELPEQAEPVEQRAVDFLVEHVTPETVLVPVGPLTNVALALDRGSAGTDRPDGRRDRRGNMTPGAEFNIWADPEAAQRVFHSGLDVTMIGLDVTHGALLTLPGPSAFVRPGAWVRSSPELVEFFSATTRGRTAGTGRRSTTQSRWRTCSGRASSPGHYNVEIETESELTRGRTVVDRWHRTDREPNAHVGVEIESDAFFELLLERVASFG